MIQVTPYIKVEDIDKSIASLTKTAKTYNPKSLIYETYMITVKILEEHKKNNLKEALSK